MAPFIPSDKALRLSGLPDKALSLTTLSAKLAGQLNPITLATLTDYMRVINSYYSNLIEGNDTRPHAIRAAQRGDYSADVAKRDLQEESLAHMAMQQWLAEQNPNLDTVFSSAFILRLHAQFYQHMPEHLCLIKDSQGKPGDQIVPGQWRKGWLEVGQHIPPAAESLDGLMTSFCETYNPNKYQGDRKLIAVMAAHHRLVWIPLFRWQWPHWSFIYRCSVKSGGFR